MKNPFIPFFGVLVMGFLLQFTANATEATASSYWHSPREELRVLLKTEGVRHPVALEDRRDLRRILVEGHRKAIEFDTTCVATTISEIRLHRDGQHWIAGYEVYASCEDSPAAGVSLYFDVNLGYLGAFEVGI